MFDNLVVCYLYLGGAGGAVVALLALADVLFRRAARTGGGLVWTAELTPRLFARGFLVASVSLALGALCLVADLGRPERFFYVFAFPTASVLTFGALALGLALASSAYLAAVALFKLDRAPLWSVRLAEWVGLAAGLATAVYTGVLLAQIEPVALWNPVLPALFACSSLSVGTAALTCCLFPLEEAPARLLDALARAGLAFAALEAAAFATYLCAAGANSPALLGSLLFGPGAQALWGGFVVPGLAIPLALGLAHAASGRRGLVGVGLPFVLVGGFFLRYCIVNAPLF